MVTLIIGLVITLSLTALTAWIFWGALLGFLLSMIPATAAYAWIGKLFVIALVGWLGGIGLPLLILIFGIGVTLKCHE